MSKTTGEISDRSSHKITIKINPNVHYQTMEGFGAAFTDAAGINIRNLSQSAQENLLRFIINILSIIDIVTFKIFYLILSLEKITIKLKIILLTALINKKLFVFKSF